MCDRKFEGYIGLLGVGLEEPLPATGYKRTAAGAFDIWQAPNLLRGRQFVFPEVKAPGYGFIFCIGLFNAPTGGELLYTWDLPEKVDMHEGVVPGIIDGRLIRGVDVSAQVIASLKEAIAATKTKI